MSGSSSDSGDEQYGEKRVPRLDPSDPQSHPNSIWKANAEAYLLGKGETESKLKRIK